MAKIVSENGTIRARVITPGKGSSGHYSESVLRDAAPRFKEVQVYWDHPTTTEESDRPERSLRDLAGRIKGTPQWESSGKDGPGIYADIEVFKPFREAVDELGPHIGMSIRASGKAKIGIVDGKSTTVIESIDNVQSVDFVTLPGRGGKVLQLFEAARPAKANQQEGEEMDKAEIQALFKEALDSALAPLRAENKKLAEALTLQALEKTVPKLVEKALSDIRLPDATKRAIVEKFTSPTVIALLPLKEGAVDAVELNKMVEAEAVRQRDYLMALGYGSDIQSQGVRMTEAELKAQEGSHEKHFTEAVNGLVDIFVGPEEKSNVLRMQARESFLKGRTA